MAAAEDEPATKLLKTSGDIAESILCISALSFFAAAA